MREAGFAPRSLLFVPGGRPDMIAKIGRSAPDAAVVDLEDAVAADRKHEARAVAIAAIATLKLTPATALLLRVNPVGSPWFADDVAAAADSAAAGVVVPKVDSPEVIAAVRRTLSGRGRPDPVIVVGIETALGVADARQILAAGAPDAAYFGAEDFIADMGGHRTPQGAEALYARSAVCLAARLAGVASVDQAVVAVYDDDRYRAECDQAIAMGYGGKICIHPRQVELAHRAFTPTDEEVAYARRVLDAGRAGVGVVDGEMVDGVHSRLAERVLARAPRRNATS